MSAPRCCADIWLLFLFAIPLFARQHSSTSGSATIGPRLPVVVASASGEKVRFSCPGVTAQIRVQIISGSGEVLYDSTWKDGDVLDWANVDNQGQPLAAGTYRCVVGVKDLQGRVAENDATLSVDGQRITIQPAAGSDGLATVVADEGSGPKVTLLAHDGANGSIVSTSGDLSFRFGDFLAGKDAEKMRLTADGDLRVEGVIQANKGIMFPDGTILTSAAGLPGVVENVVEGRQRAAVGSGLARAVPGRTVVQGPSLPAPSGLPLRPKPSASPDYQFKVDAAGVHIGTTSAFGLDVGGAVTIGQNLSFGGTAPWGGIIFSGGEPFIHRYSAYGTFLGVSAGNFTTTGGYNTGVGAYVLNGNTTGYSNVGIGSNALLSNTTGCCNTAAGDAALSQNATGSYNTAVGTYALRFDNAGFSNSAVGVNALYSNTTGGPNTASGANALYLNTTGNDNMASGAYALYSNTTASNNAASGFQALYSNTTGSPNTASGANALYSNTTGSNNTASGASGLYSNTTGNFNTASGAYALYHSTADYNTASGYAALAATTTGNNNTASGYQALVSNTTGSTNTADGSKALYFNTTGNDNTASGYQALYSSNVGYSNTATGFQALFGNTSGTGNIGIGWQAGYNLTTGNYNIDIGSYGVAGEGGAIRIGTSGNQTSVFIAGITGVSTGGAAAPVLVDGNGQLGTAVSSRRYKFDISEMGSTTNDLMRLRPVTFRYIAHGDSAPLQYGLIAEEVAEVYPEMVTRDNEGQPEAVMYQFLAPMLLNEVQKQQRKIDEQQKTIGTLEQRLEALERLAARRK